MAWVPGDGATLKSTFAAAMSCSTYSGPLANRLDSPFVCRSFRLLSGPRPPPWLGKKESDIVREQAEIANSIVQKGRSVPNAVIASTMFAGEGDRNVESKKGRGERGGQQHPKSPSRRGEGGEEGAKGAG